MAKATLEKEKTSTDAIALIKEDHRKVKKIFDQFEKTDDENVRRRLAQEAINELKIHATIEEELFYPAVRQQLQDEDNQELMEEADEEHHVAKVLIAELDAMKGTEDHYAAKFIVLAENIRHHIKEEEDEMLPEARKTKIDMKVLGERMWELKQKLMDEGVPPDAEADMVKQSGLRGDSPAKNAQKNIDVPLKQNARRN